MIELSEADARTRLEAMVQYSEQPSLSADEVDLLLDLARRADRYGVTPSSEDWTPSWDLSAAAAEGWRRKAGKVAGRFNVTLDGESLLRAQAFAHCLRMAEQYAKNVAGSLSLSNYADSADSVANL